MRSDAAASVAVVGGGFSGTMTAVHLAGLGCRVRLFEPGPEPGRGLAYGTFNPVHLLNVPASKMSAFASQPDHFCNALGLAERHFAPRSDYGSYIRAILADHPIAVERTAVHSLARDGMGWRLTLSDGRSDGASAVVLALGNEPSTAPLVWDGHPVIANPWSTDARTTLAELGGEEGDVLLIGTGLTMIDVVLSLEEAGFRGRMLAFSRRGLLPRAHAFEAAAPVELAELPTGRVLPLWRWVRRRSLQVGAQAAVDSLRPHTAALWQGWSGEERRRFLRHARPWWDVQRHRIAPEPARRLKQLMAEGRLEVGSGRLKRIEDGRLTLSWSRGERQLRPRIIVNCTGPLGDIRRTANPLLRSLLEDGSVKADPLGLGLLTDQQDRVATRLWALGPMTKGMYWEMTAVPDIRAQAERVAGAIAKELKTS